MGEGSFRGFSLSESGRAPSSWPLGTLARRSSSRRRLLNRLVWAFCKIGSRFACFSISVGNDFWESNQRSNSLSSGISLPERRPSARSASGVGRHQFKFLAGRRVDQLFFAKILEVRSCLEAQNLPNPSL